MGTKVRPGDDVRGDPQRMHLGTSSSASCWGVSACEKNPIRFGRIDHRIEEVDCSGFNLFKHRAQGIHKGIAWRTRPDGQDPTGGQVVARQSDPLYAVKCIVRLAKSRVRSMVDIDQDEVVLYVRWLAEICIYIPLADLQATSWTHGIPEGLGVGNESIPHPTNHWGKQLNNLHVSYPIRREGLISGVAQPKSPDEDPKIDTSMPLDCGARKRPL